MKILGFVIGSALCTGLVSSVLITKTRVSEDGFTLARAIPNDVFVFIAERHNPERDFLDGYWGEVSEALARSGVGEDLMELFGSIIGLGVKEVAQIERVKERASQLLAGVDWKQLGAKETVFAERLPPPMVISNNVISVPHMVWLLRGSGEGAARNFEGLAAILEGMADEINRAMGTKALAVKRTSRLGGKAPAAQLVSGSPGNVVLPLIVARHNDVVIIAVGDEILNDVLGLMDGSGSRKAVADDPRFKAAFEKLPPAEDSVAFFDMQALVKSIRTSADTVLGIMESPRDVYKHTDMSAEASRLNAAALGAYRRGDFKKALGFAEQAYVASPKSSIVLYNLACDHALLGQKDKALAWLDKAVVGGFYAPRKITSDTDLDALRDEPKYKSILTKANELAAQCCAEDIIINGPKTGEAYRLLLQIHQAYEDKEYEQGLKLAEQAFAVAPKHSRVLYSLACFHALLGHQNKALDFLEEAVDGGFYCPQHISKDPDWEGLRSHLRYEAIVTKAKNQVAKLAARKKSEETALVRQLFDRVTNAMGVLDYSATVETTDGYAAWAESIAALVPDAKSRPIYSVIGKRRQLTDFDKYLPRQTASFSASCGFDLGELYKFIEDTFRAVGPKGEALLTKWGEIQEQFGVDIQKDVVDWIDGDYISVTLAQGGGSVWLIGVANEQIAREKIGAAIDFLSTRLPQVAAENPALAGLVMLGVRSSPLEHDGLEGFKNIHIGMSPTPAVWGVADEYLILGSSADAVALCLATAKGDHPNIRNNARAMSEAIVPTGSFASVSLTDKHGLGEELATGLGGGSMVLSLAASMVPEPKIQPMLGKIAGILGKLVPVARKIDFYKSAATLTTFDGQVWHSRAVTHYLSEAERTENEAE